MASLPRPQTVLIFLICSITVGMVALSVYGWPNFGKFSYSNNTIAQIPAPITATASDFGGQNDWQKQFFENDKTGAYKATEKTTAKPAAKNLPLTATDLLGRNFFTKYVELRQSGLSSDAKAVNNAAAAVMVGGKAKNFPEGLARARESIASGKAREKLEKLKKITNK